MKKADITGTAQKDELLFSKIYYFFKIMPNESPSGECQKRVVLYCAVLIVTQYIWPPAWNTL